MGRKAEAGLRLRAGVWHINGVHVNGQPIYRSTDTGNLAEAIRVKEQIIRQEAERAQREQEQFRLARLYGIRPPVTFRELATRYLEDPAQYRKASLAEEARTIQWLDQFIGDTPIDKLHDETLRPVAAATSGKTRTLRAKLEVIRHMLNMAARRYRHPVTGLTLLAEAPLITLPPMTDKRPPYPLTWAEQRALFAELPAHLARMCLYAVNTGCRDEEICGLRWAWEQKAVIRGKAVSVFVLPKTKNGHPRAVVLNDVAQSVVDSVRGEHAEYVFSFDGHRVNAIGQSAWRKARSRAASHHPALVDLHVHDLRHTVGRRLRATGASNETRADILGHRNGNMTTEYSQAELSELYDALQKIAAEGEQAPTMLRVVNG